jgi:hypothetical protein
MRLVVEARPVDGQTNAAVEAVRARPAIAGFAIPGGQSS